MATPFGFSEQRNTIYYHNLRVYIAGADVTPWLTSQVTINRADRDGINSCTFQLSNQYHAFEITEANVEPTSRGLVQVRTSPLPTQPQNTSSPQKIGFRMGDPYDSVSGKYSELAKATIFENKNEINVAHQVSAFGPIHGTSKNQGGPGQKLRGVSNTRGGSPAATLRYPFGPGSLVLHKYDPIRVFIQNPFDRSGEQWTCEFTGYIDTKPFTQNYLNGQSVISVSCQDIRILMQAMRTQLNPAAQHGNENSLLLTPKGGQVAPKANAGFFNDLIAPRAQFSHVLAGKTFLQSVKFLLFGIDNRPKTAGVTNVTGNLGAVGTLSSGITVSYDAKQSDSDQLENWNNLVLFGSDPNDDAKVGTYLTVSQMQTIGTQTKSGGLWSPDDQFVHFLIPKKGAPPSNLIEFSMVDANVVAKIEWATRLELLTQVCRNIDYQFYVTGMGDVVFEFPMYDFFPQHFRDVFNELYTFTGHLIEDTMNDEGGQPISGLIVKSRYLRSEINNGNPAAGSGNSAGIATQVELTRTIFSNVLASRVGVHMETYEIPGVSDQNRLTQLGMIEFNKRLAEYNKFSMTTSYRPYITVNRPMFNGIKNRMGITKSVSYTYKLREDVSLSMDLIYTRQKEADGRYRFITGGEAQPISYSKILDSPSGKIGNTNSSYLTYQGVESTGGAGQPPTPTDPKQTTTNNGGGQ